MAARRVAPAPDLRQREPARSRSTSRRSTRFRGTRDRPTRASPASPAPRCSDGEQEEAQAAPTRRPALRRRRHQAVRAPSAGNARSSPARRGKPRASGRNGRPACGGRDVRADRRHRCRRRVLPPARGEPSPAPASRDRRRAGGRLQRRPDAGPGNAGSLAPRPGRELHVHGASRDVGSARSLAPRHPPARVPGADPGDEGRPQPGARRRDHVLPAVGRRRTLAGEDRPVDDDRERHPQRDPRALRAAAGWDRARVHRVEQAPDLSGNGQRAADDERREGVPDAYVCTSNAPEGKIGEGC